MWAPAENAKATDDPYKTLFVGRIVCSYSYDVIPNISEKLRITKRLSQSYVVSLNGMAK